MTNLEEGNKISTSGLDRPQEHLKMFASFWTNPSLCVLARCTRKERCERSREPRRFASEMKQCVRLTVHPNNISVSQYNVLVRGGEGQTPGRTLPSNKHQGLSGAPLRGGMLAKKCLLGAQERVMGKKIKEKVPIIRTRK
jgi:hypothetical protein